MDKVICHVGIIMDGNRRWAQEKGLPALVGHKKGAENIKRIVGHCRKKGVKVLTLYSFSTENWSREQQEVDFLMQLGELFLSRELGEFQKNKIKLKVIGQVEKLPTILQKKIKEAEDITKENDDFILVFAISYGGREEILRAIQNIIKDRVYHIDITERLVAKYLYTAGLPDPDLIIRTSGEIRTSGFLLWQSAYSEWYFCQKYWPDFSEDDLNEALKEYQNRQRRFGK